LRVRSSSVSSGGGCPTRVSMTALVVAGWVDSNSLLIPSTASATFSPTLPPPPEPRTDAIL
jgi:hypothetical protein